MSTIAVSKQGRIRATRGVVAHPRRGVRGAVRGGVSSCVVERPRVARAALLHLKVAAISVIAVVGAVVGVTGYVDAVTSDSASGQPISAAASGHAGR